MKKVIGYDIDDILDLVKLERRRSVAEWVLPAVGLVALGAAIGGGVGLMLAPSSGRRLRQDVGSRIDQIRQDMGGRIGQLRERLKTDRQNVRQNVEDMVNATTHHG